MPISTYEIPFSPVSGVTRFANGVLDVILPDLPTTVVEVIQALFLIECPNFSSRPKRTSCRPLDIRPVKNLVVAYFILPLGTFPRTSIFVFPAFGIVRVSGRIRTLFWVPFSRRLCWIGGKKYFCFYWTFVLLVLSRTLYFFTSRVNRANRLRSYTLQGYITFYLPVVIQWLYFPWIYFHAVRIVRYRRRCFNCTRLERSVRLRIPDRRVDCVVLKTAVLYPRTLQIIGCTI